MFVLGEAIQTELPSTQHWVYGPSPHLLAAVSLFTLCTDMPFEHQLYSLCSKSELQVKSVAFKLTKVLFTCFNFLCILVCYFSCDITSFLQCFLAFT